ncbi:hypothetical protein [Cyclobacterium marinum]|uniref:Uncharacterized protein n=1 Tax=Cyclobacterium marinum (strain ATCC 25205 / DSM 745 / LMG 13164 / NCIMB 1802) TaxID=880070 RepID=G0J476_CYCMS|nr:hypothetical protein [Cyclobacterium marinum]AEL27502.1 hypothetical protein Cycma_3790 [Cyclobacterium marinum DSM 745]
MFCIQILFAFLLLLFNNNDDVYFQSEKLHGVNWQPDVSVYHIEDDKGEQVEIFAKKDNKGFLYWHRKLKTPVCLIGECKLIDIGIYWDLAGDFFGLEVYEEALTKTDHSEFTEKDYLRLIEILENDWSRLREYKLSDLVEKPENGDPEVDGTSGATKKEIAAEAVVDAVYTTHTIWHLSHVGEKEQLVNLTINELNKDEELMTFLMQTPQLEHTSLFFLELFANGKLKQKDYLNSLVISSLGMDDKPKVKEVALKTLSKCNYSDSYFLQNIIDMYGGLPLKTKLQVLNEFKKVENLPEPLFLAIVHHLETQQDWYIIRVFEVMKNRDQYKDRLNNIASNLSHISNPQLQSILREYQKEI